MDICQSHSTPTRIIIIKQIMQASVATCKSYLHVLQMGYQWVLEILWLGLTEINDKTLIVSAIQSQEKNKMQHGHLTLEESNYNCHNNISQTRRT